MEEVFKMYANSDGAPDVEPAELDPDHEESFEEDDEVETATVLTSSDDDEVAAEEAVLIVVEAPAPKPAEKGRKEEACEETSQFRWPGWKDHSYQTPSEKSCGKESSGQEEGREKDCGQEGCKEVRQKARQFWRAGRKDHGQEGQGRQERQQTHQKR